MAPCWFIKNNVYDRKGTKNNRCGAETAEKRTGGRVPVSRKTEGRPLLSG